MKKHQHGRLCSLLAVCLAFGLSTFSPRAQTAGDCPDCGRHANLAEWKASEVPIKPDNSPGFKSGAPAGRMPALCGGNRVELAQRPAVPAAVAHVVHVPEQVADSPHPPSAQSYSGPVSVSRRRHAHLVQPGRNLPQAQPVERAHLEDKPDYLNPLRKAEHKVAGVLLGPEDLLAAFQRPDFFPASIQQAARAVLQVLNSLVRRPAGVTVFQVISVGRRPSGPRACASSGGLAADRVAAQLPKLIQGLPLLHGTEKVIRVLSFEPFLHVIYLDPLLPKDISEVPGLVRVNAAEALEVIAEDVRERRFACDDKVYHCLKGGAPGGISAAAGAPWAD
jgi:hypothetical protein